MMDEQDKHLNQIIAALRKYPKDSREWRKATHQLLIEIQNLPGLARCSHPDYPEVLNDTLLQVTQRICQEFHSSSDSLAADLRGWVNIALRLKFKVKDLYSSVSSRSTDSSKSKNHAKAFKEEGRKPPISIDVPIQYGSGQTFADVLTDENPFNLETLEAEIEEWQRAKNKKNMGSKLWQYIQEDPEGRLSKCASRKHPDCNCQLLSQRLYLKNPPDNLQKIAREFNIPYTTVVSHWKERAFPLLKVIALELGYQPE